MASSSPSWPFLALLFAAALPAQGPTEAEFAAAVQWFETLGYPSPQGLPFVRVYTGAYTGNNLPDVGRAEDQVRAVPEFGFLRADDGQRFTVLNLGLQEEVHTRTGPGTPAHQRVGYVVESLRDAARALIEGRDPELTSGMSFGRVAQMSNAGARFVLALCCERDGDHELAMATARSALGMYGRRRGGDLETLLKDDLGTAELWLLVLQFDEPARPWADLLAASDRWLARFPDGKHTERVTGMRRVLARMVAEAAAHVPPGPQADEAARLRELVYQLREQNGKQWGQPGGCDVFADPRGDASPAARLVAAGPAALPYLLPAFDDDCLTRSLEFHRDFYFSHEVLTVAAVAAAVFRRITGENVRSRTEAELYLAKLRLDGSQPAGAVPAASAFLEALVGSAQRGNIESAVLLLSKDPTRCGEALAVALADCRDEWQCVQLLGVLAGVPGALADARLRAELRDGTPWRQVAAAVALFLRGDRDTAIDAMIAAWAVPPRGEDARRIGGFLAVCGSARAVAALASDPARLDHDLVEVLRHGHAPLPDVWLAGGERRAGHIPLAVPDAEGLAAIENLLGSLLADDRREDANRGTTLDPSVADLAAHALATRWPDRYRFDVEAPRPARQLRLRELRDQFAAARGLPVAPPPLPRAVPFDAEVLRAGLDSLQLEGSPVARERTLAKLEALGPGVLPAVRAAATAAATAERRAELTGLERRLGAQVGAVALLPDSAPFPAAVKDLASGLVGRRLVPAEVAELLARLGDLDQGPARIELRLTRADDTGVLVEFGFGPTLKKAAAGVGYHAAVRSERQGLLHRTGGGQRSVVRNAEHFQSFAEALERALAAPSTAMLDAAYTMEFR